MRIHPLKKLLLSLCMVPTLLFAADANNSAWQFDIAPYVWAINMDGRVVTGPLKTHISEDFATILHQLDVGGMLWLAAHKGPWGAFLNSVYAQLSDHDNIGYLDAHLKTTYGLFTGGLSYIALQKQWQHASGALAQLQLEPYLGARYTLNDVRLTLNNLIVKNNQHWTDPILGLRVIYDITPCWLIELAGDVGGTSRAKQYSYNMVGLLGYKPENHHLNHTTFYLGYRDLYQFYKTGRGLNYFNWDMHEFGPMVGVNFNF